MGLLVVKFPSVEERSEDDEFFVNDQYLASASLAIRKQAFEILLTHMRKALAVGAEMLDRHRPKSIAEASRQKLKSPSAIDENEQNDLTRHGTRLNTTGKFRSITVRRWVILENCHERARFLTDGLDYLSGLNV